MFKIFQNLLLGGRSPKWRSVKKEWIKKHNKCAVCETKKKLEVHHLKDYSNYPELELDKNNLITLCRNHHFLFGHFCNWKSTNKNCEQDCKEWNLKIKNR